MAALRPRTHALGSILLMVVLVGGFLWWMRHEHAAAREIVANEDEAHAMLLALGTAEREHMAATGHYGWISELLAADVLPDAVLEDDAGTPWIRTPGYRIDVLLSPGNSGDGSVELALEGRRRADATLRRLHFAVVARPLEPRVSGYRIYYLDERSDVYLSDLVSDDRGSERNPLPRLHKSGGDLSAGDQLIWLKESELDRP